MVALSALSTDAYHAVERAPGEDLERRRRASRVHRVEGIVRRGLSSNDDDVDTLDKCQELKGKKYDECVEEWLAESPPPTPAPMVMLAEPLPTSVADVTGFASPSSIHPSDSVTSDFTGSDPVATISDDGSEAASKSDKGDTNAESEHVDGEPLSVCSDNMQCVELTM